MRTADGVKPRLRLASTDHFATQRLSVGAWTLGRAALPPAQIALA